MRIKRRHLSLLITATLAQPLLLVTGSAAGEGIHDIGGSLPPLAFVMTDARNGRTVTAADFHGQVVLLYFGYTFCPDVCPTTIANLAAALDRLGPDADRARILFVTVDPDRDNLAVLQGYAALFSPRVTALRGTADELTALARRYRVVYSAGRATPDRPYEVIHSAAVYVFDATGAARLLIAAMDSPSPDVAGTAGAIRDIIERQQGSGLLARLLGAL
ncbi:MAG: SCO family protein [Pseudomonadota bacterium]|nr:SCO family protein [Pseudomonadota bacterium]